MIIVANSTAFGHDDYSSEMESQRRIREIMSAIADFVFIAHIVIAAFGISANSYVIFRVVKLARNDPDKYRNGIGIGLLSMAIADLLSLFSITIHYIVGLAPIDASEMVKTCVCKILLFSTHTMTSASIWSWLLMSTVRYLAIRHPLAHLRLWNMPKRAISFFWFMSSATNVWLLFAIDYGKYGCEENMFFGPNVNRFANLTEIVWSACVPVAAIFYMDVSVLFGQQFKFKSTEAEHETKFLRKDSSPKMLSYKHKSAVRIWLTMAFIDALLIIPDNICRILMLTGMLGAIPTDYHLCGRMVAQALYFSQFAFNALYLAVFVYDKSTRSRFVHYNSVEKQFIGDE